MFIACVEAATVLMESLKKRLYKGILCSTYLLIESVGCGVGGN